MDEPDHEVFDVGIEIDRLSIHEASHAVIGYVLGGAIGWVAVRAVGRELYPEESEATMGSTMCEFPKPWLTAPMSAMDEVRARIVFSAKNIVQVYAGPVGEDVILGAWPKEGHLGDFDRINMFLKGMFASCGVLCDPVMARPVDVLLQNETRALLSDEKIIPAIKGLAAVVRTRGKVEGADAIAIIEAGLVEFSTYSLEDRLTAAFSSTPPA